MTDERMTAFCKDLSDIANKYSDVIKGDSAIETILYGIAEVMEEDRKVQTHIGVLSCLSGAIEYVRRAAFNYYASWK